MSKGKKSTARFLKLLTLYGLKQLKSANNSVEIGQLSDFLTNEKL